MPNILKRYILKWFLIFSIFSFFISFLFFYLVPRFLSRRLAQIPKEQISQKYNPDFQIHFANTSKLNIVPAKNENFNYSEFVAKSIKQAESSVDMAMYSFSSKLVSQAIENAAQKGVVVNILIDPTHTKEVLALFPSKNPNIHIFPMENPEVFSKHSGSMHHKFLVIDKLKKPRLILSSLNLTDIQNENDIGFVLESGNPDLIKSYSQEFDRLKSGFWGLKKFLAPEYAPYSKLITFSQGNMEIWWSPGKSGNAVNTRTLDLINSAQSNIKVICWQITSKDIMKALTKKAKKGVLVQVITDSDPFQSENMLSFPNISNFSVKLNNKPKAGKYKSFIHEHVLIVDDRAVLFGTNNWTAKGFYRNDEAILYTDYFPVADDFVNHFNELESILDENAKLLKQD